MLYWLFWVKKKKVFDSGLFSLFKYIPERQQNNTKVNI